MQLGGIVERLVNWTAIGYQPDVVVTGSGPHSMFARYTDDEYRGALTAAVSGWTAWTRTLVRLAAASGCLTASYEAAQRKAPSHH